MSDSRGTSSVVATALGLVGILLYVLVGFLYLSSGLVVPVPWVVLLWVVWLAGWYVVVRVYLSRRAWVPAVAIAAAVIWWVLLIIGGQFLGWTA